MSLMVIPNGGHWYFTRNDPDVDKIKLTYEQNFDNSVFSTIPYKENQIIVLFGLDDDTTLIKCIDTKENKTLWEKKFNTSCIESKPKIVDKYLYLPIGNLRCIDLDNGNEIFSVSVSGLQSSIKSVDFVDDNHVIVSGIGFIASINLLFQKQDWVFTFYDKSLDCVPEKGYGDCYSCVIPQKDFIWCIGRCQLYKIKYSGQIIEQQQLEEWMYHACIDQSGKYIYATSDTTLYCIDLSTFKTVWKFANGYKPKVDKMYIIYDSLSVAYDNTRIYCTFDNYHEYHGLICFDAKTGKEVWRKDDYDEQPVGYNNLLFLIKAYIDDNHKWVTELHTVNHETGEELKTFGPYEGLNFPSTSIDRTRIILSHSNWRFANNTIEGYIKCFSLR
jgi:outer membrane protein assembly factor BamB